MICTDLRRINSSSGTGASSYARSLRQSLPEAGFRAEVLVDAPLAAGPSPARVWRWAKAVAPWPFPTSAPVEGARMAADVFRQAQMHFDIYGRYLRLHGPKRPAVMHWSYPLPLHFAGVPNIYSVLDLIPLLQPDLTPIDQRRAHRLLHRLRHEAAHLVTISEASRSDIITALGWPAALVTNTSLAVDVSGIDPSQTAAVMARAGIESGGFFLHVGTVERRKNIARLIAAYRASGSTRALVLAGPDGWGAADELASAADLLVPTGPAALAAFGRPRVVRLDWTPRPALLGLMQGAAAVLAPSLAEGFGLPAIEAMALGTPALTSRGGAPQEVTGGAALLVDPVNVHDIAAGITALDGDTGLRATLSAAGRVQALAYTQAAYAARLAALYGAVLDRNRATANRPSGDLLG